ncbi:hypothetical protein bcgnr5376_55980 [Bacillus cereus]
MGNYKVLSKEEMNEQFKNDDELIQYILSGELSKKPFVVKKRELQETENKRAAEEGREPVHISDLPDVQITDSIVTKGFDFENKDDGNLIYPYYNEREDSFYDLLFQGLKMLPAKGFFWLVDTAVENKPFGMYRTETSISKVMRKQNDFRFPNVKKLRDNPREGKSYIDEKYFYYDFEEEKYIQVKIELDKEGNPANDETEELYRRRETIDYITVRFSKVLREYREFFIRKYEYIQSKSKDVNNTKTYIEIFTAYRELLTEAKQKLPVKLILGHVDSQEYAVLSEHIDSKISEVLENIAAIDKILKHENTEIVVFTQEEWAIKYKAIFERLGSSFKSGYLKSVLDFITRRPEYEKQPKYTVSGYIVIKDEKGFVKRLIPNLGTVESRDFFTEFQSSDDKVVEYERKLIEHLNNELVDYFNKKYPRN